MLESPSVRPMIEAAKKAVDRGFDSIWAGDSLLARPRHDPITLLAGVAGAIREIELGTAVLLPALRNPVVLAQQLATLDQLTEGRLIVGAGIAPDSPAVRAEFTAAGTPFEGRVGRYMEGIRLCRALWSGQPVDWEGRWSVKAGVLAPVPYRDGGPLIWSAASVPQGIERAARHHDGWFPIGPDPATFAQRNEVFQNAATLAGRKLEDLTTAIYLTVSVMDDTEKAEAAIDTYLEGYYQAPASALRSYQACKGGDGDQVIEFIRSFVEGGAQHVIIRCVGDHDAVQKLLCERRDELMS
jgi:alkanesulfonate monooxygenase SsuD/methylene tetrahydromethanopterin reductase-like flavin-dependent oxidoreductase (luciferase family)